jgi:hypothetical protein
MSPTENIESRYPFLRLMHLAHFTYLRELPLNTVDYFLGVLDALDPEKRTKTFGYGISLLNGDKSDSVQNSQEDYAAFSKTLRQFGSHPIAALLIIGIVHLALYDLLRLGDTTDVENVKSRLVGFAEHLISKNQGEEAPPSIEWLVDHIENLSESSEEYHKDYVYFCENVVEKLLAQGLSN